MSLKLMNLLGSTRVQVELVVLALLAFIADTAYLDGSSEPRWHYMRYGAALALACVALAISGAALSHGIVRLFLLAALCGILAVMTWKQVGHPRLHTSHAWLLLATPSLLYALVGYWKTWLSSASAGRRIEHFVGFAAAATLVGGGLVYGNSYTTILTTVPIALTVVLWGYIAKMEAEVQFQRAEARGAVR
jgi:hypothetical protein